MKSSTVDDSSRALGVCSGLGVGVSVWIIYFIQASVLTPGVFWDVFVLPLLAAIFFGAVVAAYLSATRTRWWIGFASGVVLVLPIALLVFAMLFAVLRLE